MYFPKSSATPTGPRWAIDREAYRGYPPLAPSQRKPDLIAIKMTITAMQQAPVPMPQVNSRDFLWIECKAAVHDVPSGWKTVIEEAVTRLSTAHPTRQVFLLIAVGWKWIFLLWDPSRTINQPQLWIAPYNRTGQPWSIDPRITSVLSCPWVNTITGEILVEHAMTLDCFSTTLMPTGVFVLSNARALGVLEQLLIGIQTTPLQGLNPPEF